MPRFFLKKKFIFKALGGIPVLGLYAGFSDYYIDQIGHLPTELNLKRKKAQQQGHSSRGRSEGLISCVVAQAC